MVCVKLDIGAPRVAPVQLLDEQCQGGAGIPNSRFDMESDGGSGEAGIELICGKLHDNNPKIVPVQLFKGSIKGESYIELTMCLGVRLWLLAGEIDALDQNARRHDPIPVGRRSFKL